MNMNKAIAYRDPPGSGRGAETHVPNVLVVDPHFEAYQDWAAAARQGEVQIHFRSSGQAALALMRRVLFDVCIVGDDLDDMAGEDFLELLRLDADRNYLEVAAADVPGMLAGRVTPGEPPAARDGRPRFTVPDNVTQFAGSMVASAAAAATALGLLLIR